MRDAPRPIGQSRSFLDALDHVSRIASLTRPVLIIGERGTGKELFAQRLHFLSEVWEGPLIKLNCAALPESLLEAELFGHEAGAFTGATRRRLGRFELADDGTLFLDEIANAPLTVQEKILRVVEYGELERIGGTETIRVKVRLVAATNVDLPAMAQAGKFRDDLLDRLAFDVVTVPPLRGLPGDIPVLAEFFGRQMAAEVGWSRFAGFTKKAADDLAAHGWPGNVRELKNVVERAVAHGQPDKPVDKVVLDPFDSPWRPKGAGARPAGEAAELAAGGLTRAIDPSAPFDLRTEIDDFEKQLIAEALRHCRFNQRETARHLGLAYHSLRNLMRKYGLATRDDEAEG